MKPTVISVPYRYDQFEEGLGLGPGHLLTAGLSSLAGSVLQAHLDEKSIDEDRTAVNIGRLGRSTARLVAQARSAGEPVLVIAGDDTASVGVVSGIQQSDGATRRLGVIWIDAHGDFNTPESSYSGILAGMPLAVIGGLAGPRWRDASDFSAGIPGERMLLVGVRDIDKAEDDLIRAHHVQRVTGREASDIGLVTGAITALANQCELLFVNIDLDVLDPHLVPSSTTPSASGLTIEQLVAVLKVATATGKVAVICVTSLNPLGGTRGKRSVQSAWAVVSGLLADWTSVPGLPR
ncbi:MAG TPA: arginase family protein [Thermomicrobiales bacterium]|nr:arginase family protein [Thermomicrobiales bacterium]HRA49144.1 arginase family protein [Thermomicrobiales bacterium]